MFSKGSYKNLSTWSLGLLLSFCSATAFALPITYGSASHQTRNWQELATYTDGVQSDTFGTFWSVDGGLTWGRDDLFVGQSVQFKFNVHKRNVGTHYADFLKAWVDLDQDGQFDESDAVAYLERALTVSESANIGSWNTPNIADFSVISDGILLTQDHIGEIALRARVVCSESLVHSVGGGWNDQWNPAYMSQYQSLFSPTGHYHQGEVEEWILRVSDVPDSSALLLMALSLLGLAIARNQQHTR